MKIFTMYFEFTTKGKTENRAFHMEQNPFNSNFMYTYDNWYACKVGTLKNIKSIILLILHNKNVNILYITTNIIIKGVNK